MKTYIGDTETNGLLSTVDKVWCLCLIDDDTSEELVFTREGWGGYKPLEDAVPLLNTSKLYFHNGIAYDRPVLNKLLPGCKIPFENVRDTLIMSRLSNFERENYGAKSNHSVENFGRFFGEFKQVHEDWSQISHEMINRCVTDTRLGRKIKNLLLKELKGFSKFSLDLEHDVAEVCRRIRENGFTLNYEKATDLLATVDGKMNKLGYDLAKSKPRIPSIGREVNLEWTKATKKEPKRLHARCAKPLGDDIKYLGGDYSTVEWNEFNPGSRPQIAYQLKLLGWKPEKFTAPSKSHPNGQPKVDEDTLLEAAELIPEAADISQFLMLGKRSSQIRKWVELYNEETGRVHGTINHIGARTHRASHSDPNFAQVPSVPHDKNGNILFGLEGTYAAECRDVWTVPDGYKLVGVDASAIQLVILAHAMGDEEFSKAVAFGKKSDGTDVHTLNRNILRDIIKEELPEGSNVSETDFSRDNAKTWIYAFLLGAGLAKLRYVMNLLSSTADVKSMFLTRLPKLAALIKKLRESVYLESHIQNIDGRWFNCDNAHYALSYVLQGTEQTIMKMALVRLQKWIDEEGIDAKILAWVHDEFQIEVRAVDDIPRIVKEKTIKIIEEVGKDLKLNCFLTGEGHHEGTTWLTSH